MSNVEHEHRYELRKGSLCQTSAPVAVRRAIETQTDKLTLTRILVNNAAPRDWNPSYCDAIDRLLSINHLAALDRSIRGRAL